MFRRSYLDRRMPFRNLHRNRTATRRHPSLGFEPLEARELLALLIEEGFPAGGASPTASQYRSDPDSTNGTNNDAITGQGPAGAIGFDAGVNWTSSAAAATVYPKVLDTGLSYTDGMGQQLRTSVGAVDWHRVSGSIFDKQSDRVTNLTGSLPNTGYFSALMQFTSGTNGQVEFLQHNGSGGNARSFVFGFDTAGHVRAATESSGTVEAVGATVFAANMPYLLFGEIVNDGTNDDVRIWVNPADLTNPMAGGAEIVSTNIGSGWVGANSSYTIRELGLFAAPPAGGQFIFDEVRVGESFADVLPLFDGTPPTVATLSPADNAGGVAVDANLVVSFSENVTAGSGNVTVKNLTDGIDTVLAANGTQITFSGSDMTIDPALDLLAAKSYAVQIDATAVTDVAGNAFAGFADNTTWNFTTAIPPATNIWDGEGVNGNWSTAENWVGDVAPSDSNPWDTYQFGGMLNLASHNDAGGGTGGHNVNDLVFLPGAGAFTLTDNGDGFDLLGATSAGDPDGDADIVNNSTNTQTINLNLYHRTDFNTGLVFNAAAGDIVVGGAILNQSGSTDPVRVLGDNTVTFGGVNTYQDATVIGSGMADDFEAPYSPGLINSAGTTGGVWDSNGSGISRIADDSGNQILEFGWTGGWRGAFRSLGADIGPGESGIVEFRVQLVSDDVGNSIHYGVTDVDSPATTSATTPIYPVAVSLVDDGDGSNGTYDLMAGGTTLASGLSIGTWYDVRLDIDNATDTYDVSLDGVQLNGTSLSFSSAVTSALDRFAASGRNLSGNFQGRMDDLAASSNSQNSTLLLNNNHAVGGDYTVTRGAILGGIGGTASAVESNGTISPGDPAIAGGVGALGVGDLTMARGGLQIQLNADGATNAGTSNDVVTATGNVALGDGTATLEISSLGNVPTGSHIYTLIDNTGGGTTTGFFQGLPEGTSLAIEGVAYTISYVGGTGNDVILNGVIDTTPPAALSTVPVDGEMSASINGNLVVTFDETIQASSGNVTIMDITNGTNMVIPIGDPQISTGGSTLTINPAGELLLNTDYTVSIDAAAIQDVSGNGLAADFRWSFHTEAIASGARPTVGRVNPGFTASPDPNGQTLVSITRDGVTYTDIAGAVSVVTSGSTNTLFGAVNDGDPADTNAALTGLVITNGQTNMQQTDYTLPVSIDTGDLTGIFIGEISTPGQDGDPVTVTPLSGGSPIGSWTLDIMANNYGEQLGAMATTHPVGVLRTRLTSFTLADFVGGTGALTGVDGIRLSGNSDFDPDVVGTFNLSSAPTLTPASPTLPAIDEDDVTNTGVTVASLVGNSITDVAFATDAVELDSENHATDPAITLTGSWSTSTSMAGFLGANYLHDGNTRGTPLKSVEFAPTLLGGSYDVQLRWTTGGNRATNTPVDILDGHGVTTRVTVNQENNNGIYISLGTFDFAPGNAGTITVSNDGADDFVIVDALRLERVAPLDGIAVVGQDAGNGKWQGSVDGGASWNDITSMNDTLATVFKHDDFIRFIADGQNGTSATLTYRAWDRTSGTAGEIVDASATGGYNQFSDATDSATITVTSVNDAPTIAGTVGGQTVNDNSTLDPFTGVLIDDVDEPAQTLTVTITLDDAAKGTLTNLGGFSDLGGGSYQLVDTAVNATAAIQALTFAPSENRVPNGSSETTTLTISVDDGVAAALTDSNTTVISTAVNDTPVVASATVTLDENSSVGTLVHAVTASDADRPAQDLTYAITAGNPANAFAIDSSGNITVADAAALDFESNPTFALSVEVTDDGSPPATGAGTITVNLNDVNEPHVVADQAFSVNENSANGTVVGSIAVTDVDSPAQPKTFSVIGGTGTTALDVDPSTGVITVADESQLDFESSPSLTLVVSVADNDAPPLSDSATITVNLNDIDESGGSAAAEAYIDSGGNLVVSPFSGSSHRIIVSTGQTSSIWVNLDDVTHGPFYPSSGVVNITTGDGADYILMTGNLPGLRGIINAGNGENYVAGGSFADTITTGTGRDVLLGGSGDDTFFAGAHNDRVDGGVGNDVIHGEDGNDELIGFTGDDTIHGGAGDDLIGGGDGNDFVHGDGGRDTINGGGGNDVLLGDAGGDRLFGSQGRDLVFGGSGADGLSGDQNDDALLGGPHAIDDATLRTLAGTWFSSSLDFISRVNAIITGLGASGDGEKDGLNGSIGSDLLISDGPDNIVARGNDQIRFV